jgi:cold shock CspA family protein
MEREEDTKELLAELTPLIAEVPLADHPYWASAVVRNRAADALLTSHLACQLDRMWAGLQDWYELREQEAAEALSAIRQAATEWPEVKDEAVARDRYFERWNETVRTAFERPAVETPPAPATVVGRLDGEVAEYNETVGVGFIRADLGGPTYFFRWNGIDIDAHHKTLKAGERVRFDARVSAAGERFALDVSPDR